MKQVVLRGGVAAVADVPAPSPARGRVLVANAASVISTGTERSAVEASGTSLATRAIRNPALVLKTLQRLRDHGARETIDTVRGAAAREEIPLGYSSAGIVIDTGGIPDFAVGGRVACAGAGSANHAEVVSVPGNLVAAVPDDVSLRDAAFTTLGAIALQGVRRAEPTLGERAVVVGLGLLGQLTVQILRAAGCRVAGVEPVASRRELAVAHGAEIAVEPSESPLAIAAWTGRTGADAVVITASSESDAIVNQAVRLLRRKGRVVPVGAVGLALERPALYEREADVLISTSYGPGRYDPSYEQAGIDYPLAYVRWTENRNMEEFLRLLSTRQVMVDRLADVELPIDRADEAYAAIEAPQPPLAGVLSYDLERALGRGAAPEVVLAARTRRAIRTAPRRSRVRVAIVGPGAFVRGTHLPTLGANAATDVKLVVARTGTHAAAVAREVGGADAATDWQVALDDPDVDLVLIGTRHDSHAEIAAAALRSGKSVFVEKPLGLTRAEIDDVVAADAGRGRLAIGFNRPFSPLARELKAGLDVALGPMQLVYRVNAPLPPGSWLNDPLQGGGRLLGEACHMFDFANWLCGPPVRVHATALAPSEPVETVETATVTVEHSAGSISTLHYSGIGAPGMPKERIEVLRGGNAWVLDDFRRLSVWAPEPRTSGSTQVQKGHRELLDSVVAALLEGAALEPGVEAAYLAQSVALAALDSLASGEAVAVLAPPALAAAAAAVPAQGS